MKIIGLTGGVASGKSAVARLLAERGAVVLDADRIAHEVLASADVVTMLVGRWGPEILDEEGQPRRSAIAQRVFGDSPEQEANRRFLEGVIHPRVRRQVTGRIQELRAAGDVPVVVIDAPLLLEAGWQAECDEIVFVDAPEALRRDRALARGWSAEQFAEREQAQWPMEKKRGASHQVVANHGELADLSEQVAQLWRGWAS